MLRLIERTTEPRALIFAPGNEQITIFETIPAAGEPAGMPSIWAIVVAPGGDESRAQPIGTAGNLAGALKCAADYVARAILAAEATTSPDQERDRLAALLAAAPTERTH